MTGDRYSLHLGDSLRWLPTLAPGAADLVLADPPYSSGGIHAAARTTQSTETKYTQQGSRRWAGVTFPGDNRDQRSWTRWCSLWLADALRATRPGGYLLLFVDWRQLPAATDAVQAAGWIWRGVIAWDKTAGARAPHPGYFRHQCEYLVWGTNGRCAPAAAGRGPWPGCYTERVSQADKHHPTGKPTALLRRLVQCCPPGGLVLDPFPGSATAGVAALLEGRRYLACEIDPGWHGVGTARLAAALSPTPEPPRAPSPGEPPPPAAPEPPRPPGPGGRNPPAARPPGRRPRRGPRPRRTTGRGRPADDA